MVKQFLLLLAAVATLTTTVCAQTNIMKGGTYLLVSYVSGSPKNNVTVYTTEPVTIKGWFWNSTGGNCVASGVNGTNITVQNVDATCVNTNIYGERNGVGVYILSPKTLIVKNSIFNGWRMGVQAMGPTTNSVIFVQNNAFQNANGAASDGQGGYLSTVGADDAGDGTDDGGGGTAVQLLWFSNLTGFIWNNQITNSGASHCGDSINLYDVQAPANNHFLVMGNYIQGCVPHDPTAQSTSSAITTDGDKATGQVCQYIDVINNVAVHCSGGIGLAYGLNNTCQGNIAVFDGVTPAGVQYQCYSIGIDDYDSGKSNQLFNNQSACMYGGGRNDYGVTTTPNQGTYYSNTTLWPGQIVTTADEQWATAQWNNYVSQNGIIIGPQ